MTRILFMGRKQVAADALNWLSSQDDATIVGVLTDDHLETSPTREMAETKGIPVLDFKETAERLEGEDLHYDLGISMLYWKRITKPFLDRATLGNINFHPAPLPEYKGTAGYNLAILESLQTWAVTAHYMDEDFDTGGIIATEELHVDVDTETAQSLEQKSQPALLNLFIETISAAISADGRLPATANTGGRYVSRSQMEAMKLVQDCDDVDRKIRAFWFPPYDGACVDLNGDRYTLVNRQILESLADPAVSSLFSNKNKA